MEVGKPYYIYAHAYHHVIGEVEEIHSLSRVRLKRVVWVYSCKRGWTEFFRDGIRRDDTVFHHLPDGTEVNGFFMAVPWNHDIPEPRR